MQTFGDVEDAARDPRQTGETDASGWPPRSRRTLFVPGEKALVLPVDQLGYDGVADPGENADLLGEHQWAGISALVERPGLVVPLKGPSDELLQSKGYDKFTARRTHNPRSVGLAVAVDLPGGRVWGVGRLVVVEGGLRPGSTQVVGLDAAWWRNPSEAEDELAMLHIEAADSVKPQAEPNGAAWRTLTVLLGSPRMIEPQSAQWKRCLTLTAGLRRVNLEIRTNPDSNQRNAIRSLRSKPPSGLLVWADGVASPESYIAPVKSARPGVYAAVFGGPEPAPISEIMKELLLHLREFAPLAREVCQADALPKTWEAAAKQIRGLCGPHFTLTRRADGMLEGNPYPNPARMAHHLTQLCQIAERYYLSKGKLGDRLVEVAHREFGIEIALTDHGLAAPVLADFGGIRAEPHVKVDDHKHPNQCGRIYFALDRADFRFVVDHIGLHDYP